MKNFSLQRLNCLTKITQNWKYSGYNIFNILSGWASIYGGWSDTLIETIRDQKMRVDFGIGDAPWLLKW